MIKLSSDGKTQVSELRGADPESLPARARTATRDLVRDTSGCKPQADRPKPCRRVRLHRRSGQLPVHAAVPRRLLHERRSDLRHRPADRLHDERDARELLRRPHGRGAVRGQRRLQPRSGDRRPGSRARHARRARADQPGRPQRPRPVHEEERPDRRHRRDHRRALADLGRDRLERDHARGHGGPDPPGEELHRRSPLHRRDAQAQGRRRADARTRPRASATTATTCRPARRRSTTSAVASRTSSRSCGRRTSSAANLYLAWDFTVASDENIAKNMLAMRNEAFADLGDTDLGDGIVEGECARVRGDLGPELRADRPAARCRRTPTWRDGSRARSPSPAT